MDILMTTFPTVRLNIFPNSISIIIDFFQLNKLTFILYIHHQTFTAVSSLID